MVIGILALQGDFDAHARALAALGVPTRLVRSAAGLEGISALVLPGGESTTMLKFLQAGDFWQRLQAAVHRLPVLATCAGAILLARRVTQPEQPGLGALDVTAARNAYGRQLESSIRAATVRSPFVAALGAKTLEAVLIRAPRFQDPGPGVEVVAEIEGEPVLLRQGNILAASFHPELSAVNPVHRWFVAGFVSQDSSSSTMR